MRLTNKTIMNRSHPNGMDRRKTIGRIQETKVTIRAGIITDRICSEMEKFNCFLLRIHITSICKSAEMTVQKKLHSGANPWWRRT